MDLQDWAKTGDFLAIWKSAFSSTKALFAEHSLRVAPRTSRYRSNAIWTEFRDPVPGVRLIAVELQPDVYPLILHYRVWVYEEHRALYDRVLAAALV